MEKRVVVLVLSLILLPGCATGSAFSTWFFGRPESYYTDPNSPGYKEFHYSALCEQCGRVFTFSTEQWNTISTVTCPYDGHPQDLKMANNRFNYQQQQQQQAQAQRQAAVVSQILQGQVAQNQARQACINNCRAMSVAQQGGGTMTAYTSYVPCQAACQ